MEKKFRKLFWPTFIELLFFMLMGTIDTLMLSNFSDYAVGAVGNANTLIQLFAVLFLVISNGVAVLVSQYLGANQKQIAFKVIGTGLIVNIIVGLLLSTTLVLSSDVLLHLVNTKPEILVDSKTYLQVISISLIFVAA
ncbi:MAG: MATE family efflux transporter, partial [Acholeplasmataceae bacterium]|nr:MATE family efflux transporter [Acholeplasmataceae bacterium]